MHEASPLTQFSLRCLRRGKRWEFSANMSAGGDVEKKRVSFVRKNTSEERARMQNERRKRKRKARAAKKVEERQKGRVGT